MNRMKLTALCVLSLGITSSYASWEFLDMPTDHGFGAIWAFDEEIIFVATDAGLWKTFDGKNWEQDTVAKFYYFICFVDDTLGFQVGSTLTVDGGHTWQKGDTINGRVSPLSFPQGQSLIGYGVGTYYVSKTTDGGWHWSQLPPLPDVYPGFDETILLGDICFPDDPDTGYLAATCIKHLPEGEIEYHSSYFKTTDAGQTWVLNEEGLWNDDFGAGYIDFPENSRVGYIVGSGKVFKTTDGGETWDTVLVDTSMSMNDIFFPESDEVGYVIGSNKAYKTTNGGNSWHKLEFGQDTILHFCHFVNDSLGFITGINNIEAYLMPYDPGFVLKTTDGLLGIAEEEWVEVVPENLQVISPIGRKVVLRYSNQPQGFHAQVFDATGRRVDELHSNVTQGTITWGEGKPSGVYFIHVSENQKTSAAKVVLVK